jgi:hypothetical protein
MPENEEEAEKVSPAFRAFMKPAHEKHPGVVRNWDIQLRLLAYLRKCTSRRIHTRGEVRQGIAWTKTANGNWWELTSIKYDGMLADRPNGASYQKHVPLTADELRVPTKCSV